jgi:hypothetical protein
VLPLLMCCLAHCGWRKSCKLANGNRRLYRTIIQSTLPRRTSKVAETLHEEPINTNRERFLAVLSQVKLHGRFHHYQHVQAMHEGRHPKDW